MHPEQQRLFSHIFTAVGLEPPADGAHPQEETSPSDDPMVAAWERNVSIFEPRHTVTVSYPAPLLLTDKAEVMIMNKPFNAEQRYAPFPLVQDDDVKLNTCRQDWTDNSFFSMHKASPRATSQDCRSRFTNNNLWKDLRIAAQCHGSTNLTAVIYRTGDTGTPRIRIRRGTTYITNNLADHDARDYDMPLGYFLNSQDGSRWYQDLIHLIGISDDRAARHVYLRLVNACQPETALPGCVETFEKFLNSFGKDRLPNYEFYLDQVTSKGKRNSFFSKAKICILCNKPLGGSKHQATILPCDDTHVVGKQCLLSLMKPGIHNTTADPAKLTCPHPGCKAKIFLDPILLSSLKFNVVNNIFQNSQSTAYDTSETFERASSDLDKIPAALNSTSRITINSTYLLTIFHKILHNSIPTSTLHHLKHHQTPEFRTFSATLSYHLRHLEGVNTTPATLTKFLKKQIFLTFDNQWNSAGLLDTFTFSEKAFYRDFVIKRDHAGHQQGHLEKILPKGFVAYMYTLLNRTLNFLVMRAGDVRNAPKGEEFYKIGGREFYNPEYLRIVEMTREMREIFIWQRGPHGRVYLKEFSRDENARDSLMLL